MFFITGADAFAEIATWHDYPAILTRAHFVVVSRPGRDAASLRDELPSLAARMRVAEASAPPGAADTAEPAIWLVHAKTPSVSATAIRLAAGSSRAIAGMTPPLVEQHIARHGLVRPRPWFPPPLPPGHRRRPPSCMRKSTAKRAKTSPAARKRAAKKTSARKRAASTRPEVPVDRMPVVPETRTTAPADTTMVSAAKAKLPLDVVEAVKAAASKKADHVALLDLRKAAGFTDFFLLATGANARQIRAIAEAVEEALGARRVKPSHTEGYDRTGWILLDYFDFVVHVFSAETRRFYGLERLWGSAIPIDISSLVDLPAPASKA